MEDGGMLSAKLLILATGVVDELPDVPGLTERWGKSVFHCPYCHGYELDNGPLGVLAVGEVSMHHGMLIPEWGRTTMFLNGAFEPDDEQMSQLLARGVTIERERVEEIAGGVSVKLVDGRTIELAGLFVASRTTPSSPLAGQLGCEIAESPLGLYISTNDMKETSVDGVFACGDAARAAGNVTFAISDGALAGLSAHRSLIFGST
jgi:thioredoxin reductase